MGSDVILKFSPFTRIIKLLWNKRTELILFQNFIYICHDMSVLFWLYLELWMSDWGDLWVLEKLRKLSTFRMFNAKANYVCLMA